MNVLLITADDLNYNSLGFTGCPISDISPNLDKLASEALHFENAHVTIAVCQPSRSVLMTGRYPEHNGAVGFNPIFAQVTTLTEHTHRHGYFNGIIGKETHIAPKEKFLWDYYRNINQKDATVQDEETAQFNAYGRNPKAYGAYAKEFFKIAQEKEMPFFLMANSHDPHRPFALSEDEAEKFSFTPPVSRIISEEEACVPGFLPDIPEVRKEVAQYFTSVHRCDETVGEILNALKDSGMAEDTLIVFLSDNGMAFPFAKTNCYLNSTKTPLLIRYPRMKSAGAVNKTHLVSGIDLMPTLLDILGLPPIDGIDGKSYAELIRGGSCEGFHEVFTTFHITSAGRHYPMRAVINERYGYIKNLWHNGSLRFKNESQDGLTFKAMVAASEANPEIKARTELFELRVDEELFDLRNDPDALCNLAGLSEYQEVLLHMRSRLLYHMEQADDSLKDELLS